MNVEPQARRSGHSHDRLVRAIDVVAMRVDPLDNGVHGAERVDEQPLIVQQDRQELAQRKNLRSTLRASTAGQSSRFAGHIEH